MRPLTGDTYAHRDAIRAAGGRWDRAGKRWSVPDDQHERLAAMVARPAESLDASGVTSRSTYVEADSVRVGEVIRVGGEAVVVTGLGRLRQHYTAARIMYVQSAWVRDATVEEAAALRAREAADPVAQGGHLS